MNFLSYFLPKAPYVLTYMLQQNEYDSVKFVRWLGEFPNLQTLQKRQSLVLTTRAKITLVLAYAVFVSSIVIGILVAFVSGSLLPLFLFIFAPIITGAAVAAFNSLFAAAIVSPREQLEISRAKQVLAGHTGVKIAVLGSYGKTTMKELLATVIGQGKTVAVTPGNKNVLISHARWVNQLAGDEDVLIFEFGEYMPGDIDLLANFSRPDWAVVTGVATAHLDNYQTLDAIAADFTDVFKIVKENQVLTNHDSPELTKRLKQGVPYSQKSCGNWTAANIQTDLTGLHFIAKNGKNSINIDSGLVGVHMVGPLLACIYIADNLGLSKTQITEGLLQTKPFEHRMQPYQLGPAWVIDDTYNGNLEGMRAGLIYLSELKAKRKVYVTPGLVEQGDQVEAVHIALGEAIAFAQPDKVVLMKNSTTKFIRHGLDKAQFSGEIQVDDAPLEFYTNLEHFVAAGDVVMLQNDWPDSYK